MTSFLVHAVQASARGVPVPIWLGARILALALGLALIWALMLVGQGALYQEAPAIKLETEIPVEIERPQLVPPSPPPAPPKSVKLDKAVSNPAKAPLNQPASQAPPQAQQVRTSGKSGSTPATPNSAVSSANSPISVPRIATVPTAQAGPSPGSATSQQGSTPALGNATRAMLRARECARLDVRDRPADCPPNEELMRLLAAERGPKYRPENAEGFSRNEQRWRGIPPPCLDDGKNAAVKGTTLCVRFGNVPSRVRSPQEICEARGLGGCAPVPNQGAVNAAVEQVRRQEAGKAKQP